MKAKKKTFTAAEKYKVALEAIKGIMSIAQIASTYGVHPTQIHKWKKEAQAYLAASFSNKLNTQSNEYEKERAELYQQIGQLKVENDFLKKKIDRFL